MGNQSVGVTVVRAADKDLCGECGAPAALTVVVERFGQRPYRMPFCQAHMQDGAEAVVTAMAESLRRSAN